MKVLAIDYGTKNIGLALSDDTQKLAFVYTTLDQKDIFSKLKDICEKEGVEKIIVGLPIGLSGRDTEITKLVKNFVNNLKSNLKNINIEIIDERLTTVQASKLENNKNNIDELSAQVLLQAYLDKI